MNKYVLLVIGGSIVITVLVLGIRTYNNKTPNEIISNVNSPLQSPTSNLEEFTASFEIYTNGTKRVFTQSMYHNKSSEVFVENPDPSIVYVKKTGITWDNFFKTLPFSLSKECLITGTKQEFCNTDSQKLVFTINGQNSPNALDLEIKNGDELIVTYGD